MSDALKNRTPSNDFLKLLINNQSALYAYIGTLMGSDEGAQDVLQEANGKLLERFADYDPGQPFLPWAITLARFEVLTWRKRQTRDRLVLSDELVAIIADRIRDNSRPPDARLDALKSCLKRLPPVARQIVESRYSRGEPVADLAQRLGRSANAISVALFRIRKLLLGCIRSTVKEEA